MFDSKRRFVVDNYAAAPPFSSLLPGIAGKTGIPLWCFYVNRGQAVSSFGVYGKQNAILRFQPASRAYRNVSGEGFRTFLRVDGKEYYEPFRDDRHPHRLTLGQSGIILLERNEDLRLRVSVRYCVLPEEPVAAMLRQVEIRNAGFEPIELELADGIPQIMPYGLASDDYGRAGQKTQSRRQSQRCSGGFPYFRMLDGAPAAGHFAFAVDNMGIPLADVIDPGLIFDCDTALRRPRGFLRLGVDGLLTQPQSVAGTFPCCFFVKKTILPPGETLRIGALYGYAPEEAKAAACRERFMSVGCFDQKYRRAAALTEELCRPIRTKTGDPVFDAYCAQTFLDNLLRGGVPEAIGDPEKPVIFHIYRRMNGDLERDYHDFALEPEYYPQGDAFFGDVIQNRRCDVRFYPYVAARDLRTFANLIQPDGYHPMVMESTTLLLSAESRETVLSRISPADRDKAAAFMENPFTPGRFLMEAEDWALTDGITPGALLDAAAACADRQTGARYGSGYWTNQWCDIIDLILYFESVYPDQIREELFQRPVYRYFEPQAAVLPRSKRYVLTPEGVRQQGEPEAHTLRHKHRRWVCVRYGDGAPVKATLFEKLLLLVSLKMATLDAWGFGIEMEAGREGWNSGLSGLPERFGSSCGDVCDLVRLLTFLEKKLEGVQEDISVATEIKGLFFIVSSYAKKHQGLFAAHGDIMEYWKEANEAKESFRSQVQHGLGSACAPLPVSLMREAFALWRGLLGQRKSLLLDMAKCHPAYMYYDMTQYTETDMGIQPQVFTPRFLPLFLEGAIHHFDICQNQDEALALHQGVMGCPLYDQKLNMLRSCASMESQPRDLGDVVAFRPGWYTNQAVSLQLSYQYLRKLLVHGLYDEFAQCFRHFAVPFFKPAAYGRSILENVSFIVSGACEDGSHTGRGLEARFTGANADFIALWQRMLIGEHLFTHELGMLHFTLVPFIPDYLIPPSRIIEATLLGRIQLIYHIAPGVSVVPGRYTVQSYRIHYPNETVEHGAPVLDDPHARRIRSGEPSLVEVYLGT